MPEVLLLQAISTVLLLKPCRVKSVLWTYQQIHPEQYSIGKVHGLNIIHRVLGGALPNPAGDDGPREHKDERVSNVLQLLPASATSPGLQVFQARTFVSSSR